MKLTGTVDGGTLALNEVDSGDVTLIFTRGDAADSEAIPAGKYILTGIDDNGTQYTSSVLTAAESADWYISVNRLGRGKAVIDGEEIALAAGDWLRVAPAAKRQFSAAADAGIAYVCIQVRENSLGGFTADDAVVY